MSWRTSRRAPRPSQTAKAPLCRWPAGCRRPTWDVSGRCPQHRGADPVRLSGDAAPATATGAPVDPFVDVPMSEARRLVDGGFRLSERDAVTLAGRGVTAETWPAWKFEAGGVDETIVAIDSGVTVDDLPGFRPAGAQATYGGHVRAYARWGGSWSDADIKPFPAQEVLAWMAAEPELSSYSVIELVDGDLDPTSPSYLAYREAGIPADQVVSWSKAGVAPSDAGVWHSVRVFPENAGTLENDFGRDAATVAAAAVTCPDTYLPGVAAGGRLEAWAAGVSAEDFDAHREAGNWDQIAGGQLARLGVTASGYRRWRRGPGGPKRGNLDGLAVARLVNAGASIDDVETYRALGVPPGLWQQAADNGAVGADTLSGLAGHADTAKWVAVSTAAPPDILAHIAATSPKPDIVSRAVSNQSCPTAAVIAACRAHPTDQRVLAGAAENPACPSEVLSVLASASGGPTGTPASFLSEPEQLRFAAASHPNTLPSDLARLAADPNPRVRDRATANPNTPAAGKSAAGLLSD